MSKNPIRRYMYGIMMHDFNMAKLGVNFHGVTYEFTFPFGAGFFDKLGQLGLQITPYLEGFLVSCPYEYEREIDVILFQGLRELEKGG